MTGQSYIPASQRPDGTWRKPIRVRDGYVPQEEQPVYVSKGKQFAQQRSQCPVGMTMTDVQKYKAPSSNNSSMNVGYFEVGNYEPTPAIPGLNFIESSSEADKPKSKSKKSKSKSKSESGDSSNCTATGKQTTTIGTTLPSSLTSAASNQQQQTDPAKRLRNLKKRLKEIEALEQRIASGELASPEKEQVWNEYTYKMNSLTQL